MNTFTDRAKNLLKRLEDCKFKAYEDEKLVWTIGYGHTGPDVVMGLVWTQDQADRAYDRDVQIFCIGINSLMRGAILNDNQYSALVILAYNIGLRRFATSSARALALAGSLSEVPDHIRLWNKETDPAPPHELKVSQGLINRREAECALWSTPVQDPE